MCQLVFGRKWRKKTAKMEKMPILPLTRCQKSIKIDLNINWIISTTFLNDDNLYQKRLWFV